MGRTVMCILAAYLSGSVLYANVFGGLFGVRERYAESADRNPGAANAFTYGGFWCGTLTLLCDLAKGALPVYFFMRFEPVFQGWCMPFLLAAPVVGHLFPVFHKFHGGKGIAVTFGVLLGLFPYARPVVIFAGAFIFFSVFIRISPHFYRTIAAYIAASVLMPAAHVALWVRAGFHAVAALVCMRMALSREKKEQLEVKLLWMR